MAWSASLDPFPFAIPDADPSEIGNGTEHPIGFTLDELFRYYHRTVLRLHFSHYILIRDLTDPDKFASIEASGGAVLTVFSYVSNSSAGFNNRWQTEGEASLNSNYGLNGSASLSFNTLSGGGVNTQPKLFPYQTIPNCYWDIQVVIDEYFPVTASGSAYINFSTIGTKKFGGLYYPKFRYTTSLTGNSFSSHLDSISNGNPIAGQIAFANKNITLYGTTNAVSNSTNNNVVIDSWHPHDPGDTAPYPGKVGSGPIYDTTTGATLRDPSKIDMLPDGTFYNPYA